MIDAAPSRSLCASMNQWPTQRGDAAELLCIPAHHAVELAHSGTAVAVVCALAAWRLRDRAASAGQHGLWALSALLAGVMHVIVAMFLVPTGCLTGPLFGRLLAAASPWFVAAGLLRTGASASQPPLSTQDLSR